MIWHAGLQAFSHCHGEKLETFKIWRGGKVDSTTYRLLIGSLIYLTNTHPNLSYAINIISCFMQEPWDNHLNAAKRVLRYIQGTKDFGLLYTKTTNFVLGGYSDVDFARSIDDRASTLGYLMNMGSKVVPWSCKSRSKVHFSMGSSMWNCLAAQNFSGLGHFSGKSYIIIHWQPVSHQTC